jgi:diguanylate cyclase (GGDEF)-like protein
LFSDADKFKFVNDTYGHPCGDAVLVELARRVTDTVGERGTVCRYGGEEFVVVLPGLDIHQASEVGEQIRQAIEADPFVLDGVPGAPEQPLPRSVSVGVAAWSPGYADVTAEQLTQRADKAVYAAKEAGRNNVKRWGMDTGRRAADQRADQAANLGVPTDALPRDRYTHVLLIEDDPLAARLIRTMFEQNNGVSVHCRPDGRSAIEFLRDSQAPGGRLPDLILCDLNVPGYNGLQIVKALKSHARFSTIPFVMMSATAEAPQREACSKIGITKIHDKLEISEDLKGWCAELVRGLQAAA